MEDLIFWGGTSVISVVFFVVLIFFTAGSGLVSKPSADPDAQAGLLASERASSFLAQFLVFKALTAACAKGSNTSAALEPGRLAGLGSACAAAFCSPGRLSGSGSAFTAAFCSFFAAASFFVHGLCTDLHT